MARVTVPPLMRDLTHGASEVEGHGDTVVAVFLDLDTRYPGFWDRLVQDGDLDPMLVVVVDDRPAPLRLRARVREDSHIRVLPAVGGG